MNAALLAALRPLREYLASLPRNTVEDDLYVDTVVAYALRQIADDIEGTDSHNMLMDAAGDIYATVRDMRERMAIAEADDIERRRSPRLPKVWPFPTNAEEALV
jgi:hypothetical protein